MSCLYHVYDLSSEVNDNLQTKFEESSGNRKNKDYQKSLELAIDSSGEISEAYKHLEAMSIWGYKE